MEMPSFLLPANGQVSPESLARRRRMAEGMLQSGIDTSPIASPWQGAARIANALVGGLSMHNADKSEQEGRKGYQDRFAAMLAGGKTPTDAQFGEMLGDPWGGEGQQAMVADMYKTAHAAPESKVLNEGDVWMGADGNVIGKGNPKTFAPKDIDPGEFGKFAEYYNGYQKQHGMPELTVDELIPRFVQIKRSGASQVNVNTSPAAAAAAEQGKKDAAEIVVQDVGRARQIIAEHPTLTTGLLGSWMKDIGGTDAANLSGLLDTVKAHAGFDELTRMRLASPTGAALGNVTVEEIRMLQATIGSLMQSQSSEQLGDNLIRVQNQYLDLIHGKGKGPPREKMGAKMEPKRDPSKSQSVAPQGVEPELWDSMTPEEQSLWQN